MATVLKSQMSAIAKKKERRQTRLFDAVTQSRCLYLGGLQALLDKQACHVLFQFSYSTPFSFFLVFLSFLS